MECEKPAYIRVTYDRSQRIIEVYIDVVGLQEVRWDKGNTVNAGVYIFFFYGNGKVNHQLITEFFCTLQRSISS